VYGGAIVINIVLGLASRDSRIAMPQIMRANGGDVASATCIFFGVRFWNQRSTVARCAAIAITICVLIELQQLYQAPWAIRVRTNRLVGTLLGHGFLWIDIARYIVGVVIGLALAFVIERTVLRSADASDGPRLPE
jgi:Protein of unknown function (DUF2809)